MDYIDRISHQYGGNILLHALYKGEITEIFLKRCIPFADYKWYFRNHVST